MKIAIPLIFNGADKAFGSRSGSRAAQDRLFQGVDRLRLARKKRKRMTEKSKQRSGREPLGHDCRHEPGKPAGLGLGERNAGGIVDRDIPAGKFGGDAPRQRPIRRDEGGRCVFRL